MVIKMSKILQIIISSLVLQMKQSFTRPTFRFIIILQPILYSTLFYFMFKESKEINVGEYIVIGTGIMNLWSSILFSSAGDIERERYMGTLETITATPSDFRLIFLGKVLGNVFFGVLSMVLNVLFLVILFGIKISIKHPLEFLISFIVVLISFSIISMLLASIFTLSRNARMLMNSMEYPVYILCGVIFPVSILPNFIQYFSYILVPTWAVKLLRTSMIGINDYSEFSSYMFWILIISLINLLIGIILFKKINNQTRIKGTLGVH
ncbi:ABC transporter permease [Lysinibacillus sphaericus]|uniref:Transport permease protein n=1 Tax=Lysinibacillus sphaericus TaxID=1421 RepID=A0A544UIH1_LYSSH|nr:ABC transporter permease [Lysinibacillus sp. SDF0037]TQR32830.1 ABC transporter permease [Lysinibacillus sp. SDF0037]